MELDQETMELEKTLEKKEVESKLKIAKNLININMSINDISKATGLTKEQIENLK